MLQKNALVFHFHSGLAWARMDSRRWGLNPFSVTTSTLRPICSSSSCLKAIKSRRSLPFSRVTSRSRSLAAVALFLENEPKTRTFRAPCLPAISKISGVYCCKVLTILIIKLFSQFANIPVKRPDQDIESRAGELA